MFPKLSALIPCKNEINRIGDCIDSLRGLVDEIVVADSGSTDGTLAFLRTLPDVRLIEREYVNPADFKNWAIPQCQGEWILAIDADERVTPELRQEIKLLLQGAPAKDGYEIRRKNHLFGKPVRFGSWGKDKVLGLYRRAHGRYLPGAIHEHLHIDTGRVGKLKHPYVHFTVDSFEQYMEKTHRYTTWAARGMLAEGKRSGALQMLVRPVVTFFRDYVLLQGFRDGRLGVLVAGMSAVYTFLKHAKLAHLLLEREQNGRSSQPVASSERGLPQGALLS